MKIFGISSPTLERVAYYSPNEKAMYKKVYIIWFDFCNINHKKHWRMIGNTFKSMENSMKHTY